MSKDEKKKQHQHSVFSDFVRYDQKGSTDTVHHEGEYDERASYGNYLFGSSFEDPSDIDGTEPTNWTSYTSGRIGIRLFSRGLMGATFYTMAHRSIPGLMKGYNHMAKFSEQRNGLQMLAKTFDSTLAPVIKSGVRMASKAEQAEQNARHAVWFRNKNWDFYSKVYDEMGKEIHRPGRSLGNEMTSMTFDFAMGSVGDSWGRQIAAMADPNRPNVWENKDGTIDYKKFGKSVAHNAWDIFSLKQGEDWAAALPYVYQMRLQRQGINRIYPGFKLSADKGISGGSYRLNEHGRIVSSYSKAGALDLQLRFTGYNWYTLMYRDFYRGASDMLHSIKDHDGSLPNLHMPEDPVESVMDGVGQTFRYATKSFIKACIYMTPAVPFFWITRAPQSKSTGIGVVMPNSGDRSAGGYVRTPDGKAFNFRRMDSEMGNLEASAINPSSFNVGRPARPYYSRVLGNNFYPFSKGNVRGAFDAFVNPFGEACYKTGNSLHNFNKDYGLGKINGALADKAYTHDFVNASMSYTPYMIAKAETALRWDRPGANGVNLLDKAIYRFIDGVTSLNIGEVKGGMEDMREVVINPPSNKKLKRVDEEEAEKKKQAKAEEAEAKSAQKPDTKVKKPVIEQGAATTKAHEDNELTDGSFAGRLEADKSIPPDVTIH
ncbi:MAG: hypothetical protein MRY32_07805 [Rickettsiales bacterium]|nr:hypothetical protein [Rickettsiales bacterium]